MRTIFFKGLLLAILSALCIQAKGQSYLQYIRKADTVFGTTASADYSIDPDSVKALLQRWLLLDSTRIAAANGNSGLHKYQITMGNSSTSITNANAFDSSNLFIIQDSLVIPNLPIQTRDDSIFFYGSKTGKARKGAGYHGGAHVSVDTGTHVITTDATSQKTASTIISRDTRNNTLVNRVTQGLTQTAVSGGTTTLTAASAHTQLFTGTGNQTLKLPDATTIDSNTEFFIENGASGTITINDATNALVYTLSANKSRLIHVTDISSAAGVWQVPNVADAMGTAGGDLTGTYPNPTLGTSGVSAGSYGDATHTVAVTFDAKGRATSATSTTISGVAPGGSAGGDLTGTYPNPTLGTSGVSAGSYGDATHTVAVTFDAKGRATSATSTTISGVAPGGSAGGDLTGTYPNPTLASNAVTNAKMATMSNNTIKGNTSGSTAAPSDLSTIPVSMVSATEQTLTDGSTITWNLANGYEAKVTIAATGRTLTTSNAPSSTVAYFTIRVIQDGTGSRTITTWPTNTKWAGGTAPTLTTTASHYDIITFRYDGTNYYGTVVCADCQ